MKLKFSIDSRIFERKLGSLWKRLTPFANLKARDFARIGLEKVRGYTPETRPGRTDIRDLWRLDESRYGKVLEFIIHNIYPNEDVLAFFEYGTRAHRIEPVKAQILHFIIEETGEEVFTKNVFHPGTRPWRMVEKTRQDLNSLAAQWVEATIREVDRLMREGLT